MVDIKHVRQINDGFNWKCGAASLEMIFSHYGVSKSQDDIWAATNSLRGTGIGQKFILTYNLARYSCEVGLPATIYKADMKRWSFLLDELAEREIPAILSLRQRKSGQSHFVVYKGKKNSNYCFCDPDEVRDTTQLDYKTVKDLWHPQPYIDVAGFILVCFGAEEDIAICRSCRRELPIVHKWIVDYAQAVICPHCDRFV